MKLWSAHNTVATTLFACVTTPPHKPHTTTPHECVNYGMCGKGRESCTTQYATQHTPHAAVWSDGMRNLGFQCRGSSCINCRTHNTYSRNNNITTRNEEWGMRASGGGMRKKGRQLLPPWNHTHHTHTPHTHRWPHTYIHTLSHTYILSLIHPHDTHLPSMVASNRSVREIKSLIPKDKKCHNKQ